MNVDGIKSEISNNNHTPLDQLEQITLTDKLTLENTLLKQALAESSDQFARESQELLSSLHQILEKQTTLSKEMQQLMKASQSQNTTLETATKKSLNDFVCKITKQVSDISKSILDDKLSTADKRIKELDASQEKLMKKSITQSIELSNIKKIFTYSKAPKVLSSGLDSYL